MNMKNYKSFNYFGWDVDDEDPLYKNLILKNRDMTSEELMVYKNFEKNFLKNKRTALHICSHYGFITKILSEIFLNVHAFDFDNKIHTFLKHNLKKFKLTNIQIHSYGLGDQNKNVGNSDFIERKQINGPLSNHVVEDVCGEFEVKRLDDLKINNIDLMVIDTEGYELNVLKGGIETIVRDKPLLIIEVHKIKDLTSRYGYKKEEIIKFLEEIGYKARGYINKDVDLLFTC